MLFSICKDLHKRRYDGHNPGMKRVLILPIVAVSLLLAPSAWAETKTVSITASGFVPSSLTIQVDDSITWTNSDTRNRQVISQDAGFASPVLKPGDTFSFKFTKAGTFRYSDALVKTQRGTVKVEPAPDSVTLASSKLKVIFGGAVTLSGQVSNQKAGEKVTIGAEEVQPDGTRQTKAVAEVSTGPGGTYAYSVAPQRQTSYKATWQTGVLTSTSSPAVVVRVAPRVGFGWVAKRGRWVTLATKATSAISYVGRSVYLQRLNAFGEWVRIKRIVLRSDARATRFAARLPKGVNRLRILLPEAQAGLGYTAGLSRSMRVFV